jgi:hypothetical protein
MPGVESTRMPSGLHPERGQFFSSVSATCRDCSEKQRLGPAAGRDRLRDRRALQPARDPALRDLSARPLPVQPAVGGRTRPGLIFARAPN